MVLLVKVAYIYPTNRFLTCFFFKFFSYLFIFKKLILFFFKFLTELLDIILNYIDFNLSTSISQLKCMT